MLLNIVERREIAAQKVVDQDATFTRGRIDEYQLRWMYEITLITEDYLLPSARRCRRTNWVERSASIGFVKVFVLMRSNAVILIYSDLRDIDGIRKAAVPVARSVY